MPDAITLTFLQRDILKLIHTVCYKGLPETRTPLVDPTDARLPKWDSRCPKGSFSLPSGCPEPLVRACIFGVGSNESRRRWGVFGQNLEPVYQYLIDREMLEVSHGNDPFFTVFRNPFDGREILFVRIVEGVFYVYDAEGRVLLPICEPRLFRRTRYRVFKLTRQALALLDAAKSPESKRGKTSEVTNGEQKKDPPALTKREKQAFDLSERGFTQKQIAEELELSKSRVSEVLTSAKKKVAMIVKPSRSVWPKQSLHENIPDPKGPKLPARRR